MQIRMAVLSLFIAVMTQAATVVPVASMTTPRSGHSAIRLRDGRVLIAGGMVRNRYFLDSAELFDPKTKQFTPAGRMTTKRVGHATALLPDGRVLVAGGWSDSGTVASAEVYDPRTNRFTALPRGMSVNRTRPTVTPLRDGTLLFAGGAIGDREAVPVAELFDPKTMSFRLTAPMREARIAHTATLLRDGSVLVTGGSDETRGVLATSEIYRDGRWIPAAPLATARYKHTAIDLADGRVLIAGGSDARDWTGQLASAEIYEPATRRFRAAPPMLAARFKLPESAVRLPNGDILIAGGAPFAEVFANGRFTRLAGSLGSPWHYQSATALANGEVLLAGGYPNNPEATAQAWVVSR
jgi:hypothetical protein